MNKSLNLYSNMLICYKYNYIKHQKVHIKNNPTQISNNSDI